MTDTDAARRIARRLAVVIEAALGNDDVRRHIADLRATWTEESVRRRVPARVVFECGMLIGDLTEISGLLRYAEKRKLGGYLGFMPLRPYDEVHWAFTGVWLSPEHPRRRRYEARAAIKKKLGRSGARAVTMVGRWGTQARFVAWVRTQRGLSTLIRQRTGLTVKAFWRRCKHPI